MRPPMKDTHRKMHRERVHRQAMDKDKEKGPSTHTPTQLRALGKEMPTRERGHGEHGERELEEELSVLTGSQEETVGGDKQRPTPIVVRGHTISPRAHHMFWQMTPTPA